MIDISGLAQLSVGRNKTDRPSAKATPQSADEKLHKFVTIRSDMPHDEYPQTVVEVISDSMRFKPAALAAVRRFKAAHPWRGSLDERHQKFRMLHAALCEAYGLTPPQLIFGNDHASCSGRSCYLPAMNAIILRGRLSVVTYLHEFAHARGKDERGAAAFSLNLFKRVWPRQFEQCRHEGHMLRRP